jgi:hypothetical protein
MKRILVQAQSDHIASLSRGAPISAIEELVWNALDADAKEVRVDLITNALGAVESIRIADDGLGIDSRTVDSTFGNLGGSWKREGKSTLISGRNLHGRHGRGRFKALALGSEVEWRTTTKTDDGLKSYRISASGMAPGVFEIEESEGGVSTGTEVVITNVSASADSLLDAGQTVPALAARFALYLKSYPDVRIYFNGIPVTPVIVQKRTSDYQITTPGGAQAKLEIIEWKRKFTGSGKLVFAGQDGFQLHEQSAGVRSGTGASFTAYLVSPRFQALHAENALMMDELNPEVRGYLDAAKKAIKAHFAALGEEKSAFELEWEERIAEMPMAERKALLAILKRMTKANAK